MKPSLYLETTIIGYLASRTSRDLVTAANQQLTRDWWDQRREQFDLFVSEAVVAECTAGDPDAAQERLAILGALQVLDLTQVAEELAGTLVERIPLPEKAELDALHIAIATVNGMDYLLTWNCRHLANAALLHRIEETCRTEGFDPPVICTPQQLMEA